MNTQDLPTAEQIHQMFAEENAKLQARLDEIETSPQHQSALQTLYNWELEAFNAVPSYVERYKQAAVDEVVQ
jgi:hypothetical protein